ncbi:MAG: YetF domain-containing protein [Luteimonas sp.]
MSDLFDLSMPWWEFVLRATVVYVALLVLIRLSGKRTMGQFTPFDMLLVVLLGNAVQNALLGGDTSLGGGLLLAVVLIALNWLVSFVTSRSRRAEHLVEGVPVVLARDGQLFRSVLMRELVSEDDFNEALRLNGELTLTDVRIALLETNGTISVVKRDSDGGSATLDVPDVETQAGSKDP